jgi:DNA-binding NtrC family response regulator
MISILVVDDSRLARRVAIGILERTRPDWSIIEAGNAGEAMAAIRDHAVGVVLLDINMPGTDGLTLAQSIRESHPDMAIAIVSANIQDVVVARVRGMGMTFVPKPLNEEALTPFLDGAALRLKRSAARTPPAAPAG